MNFASKWWRRFCNNREGFLLQKEVRLQKAFGRLCDGQRKDKIESLRGSTLVSGQNFIGIHFHLFSDSNRWGHGVVIFASMQLFSCILRQFRCLACTPSPPFSNYKSFQELESQNFSSLTKFI